MGLALSVTRSTKTTRTALQLARGQLRATSLPKQPRDENSSKILISHFSSSDLCEAKTFYIKNIMVLALSVTTSTNTTRTALQLPRRQLRATPLPKQPRDQKQSRVLMKVLFQVVVIIRRYKIIEKRIDFCTFSNYINKNNKDSPTAPPGTASSHLAPETASTMKNRRGL